MDLPYVYCVFSSLAWRRFALVICMVDTFVSFIRNELGLVLLDTRKGVVAFHLTERFILFKPGPCSGLVVITSWFVKHGSVGVRVVSTYSE